MMVALAILMILLLALVGSFATNVAGFKRTQLLTMAQNLAELQVEDLKSMAPSVLRLLVDGKYLGSETLLSPAEKNSPLFRFSNYPTDTDSAVWRYDSGPQQTDFNIWGLTSIQSSSGTFTAGPGTTSQPATPSSGDVLLGGTMTIQPYQVLDATTGTNVGWYYRLILHKEQFPLFEKRIEVTMFSALGLPAHTHVPLSDPDALSDQDAMFDYTVTVLMKRGSTFQTLYTSGGTISSPYARDPFILSVVSPNGGETLTANGTFVVTWNASGDLTSVNDYGVYFSSDAGNTWSLRGTAGSGATSLSLTVPPVNSTNCRIQVVARFGSGSTAASDVSDSVFSVH